LNRLISNQGYELDVSDTERHHESDGPLAIHGDINGTDQTIKVPVIPFNPPHTGVNDHMGLLLTTMLTSGAVAIWILRKRKKS